MLFIFYILLLNVCRKPFCQVLSHIPEKGIGSVKDTTDSEVLAIDSSQ